MSLPTDLATALRPVMAGSGEMTLARCEIVAHRRPGLCCPRCQPTAYALHDSAHRANVPVRTDSANDVANWLNGGAKPGAHRR